jgi:hypothetical protein
MSLCSVCKGLDESVSLDYGVPLLHIRRSATDGCQTCGLLLRSALSLNGLEDTNLTIGWDMMRLDGLRIVVGSIEPRVFLFGLDMFVADGKEHVFSHVQPH